MSLDGTEFLKTANVFDLQFIPDSMEFKHPARDIATEVSYFNRLYLQLFFVDSKIESLVPSKLLEQKQCQIYFLFKSD